MKQKNKVINYPLAIDSWDSLEMEAIKKVIASNRFTMGKYVEEFEAEFAKYFGSRYSIMVNSGSSANLLAIASLFYKQKKPLQQNDEIIVPAVSWSTTYFPIHQYNMSLKFVDISIDTLNIDYRKIREAITPQTKAIFAVNLLGNPCELDELLKICDEYGLYLLEDNCESMGATYNGKYAGTFGILGTFSTFFSHHISTMEGGVIVTDDEELYHICRSLRAHGWTRSLPENSNLYTKNDEFYELFNFILPGYNLRPLEMSGAIGIEQLKKLSGIIAGRKSNASYFLEIMKEFPDVLYQKSSSGSSWFGFAIVLKNSLEGKRDIVVQQLKENGIECRPIVAGNFVKNPVIKHMKYSIEGELLNSEYIHNNGFFIGNNHKNIRKELDYFRKVFHKIMKKIKE